MRPNLHPSLVNGRFGDPAVFVEMLHRPEAILFDLGDLGPLSTRDLLRIGHVFVSHMHMDHFIGFDRLLRVNVGREKRLFMVGPEGFAAAVGHKLQGYSWDLVDRIESDLVIDAVEVRHDGIEATRFRLKSAFSPEHAAPPSVQPGLVIEWPSFRLTAAILEHHGPSLGFAIQEPIHVNIWKSKLEARGLPTGAWLQPLKEAVRGGRSDDALILLPGGASEPLGALRDLVSVERGQKIVYVTDVADTEGNRKAIEALAANADLLLIEASFAAVDFDQARQRAHLTTRAAGEMARAAGVRRVEPFHFSPRYRDLEQSMMEEVQAAFRGDGAPG